MLGLGGEPEGPAAGLVHVPPVAAPAGTKVLSYADLERLDRSYALAPPSRTVEIGLTGNMDKFIWSFDDRKHSESPVMNFTEGETVLVHAASGGVGAGSPAIASTDATV